MVLGGNSHYWPMDIISKAEDALRYASWQDGMIPPLGDSAIISSKVKTLNNTKWFKDAKVLFIKDDKLYVSLKCGYSLRSHKHVDETSITIRYDGVDLVVDSGSYNYDYKDPIRKYMVSSRAHSGIYPKWLEKVDVSTYCYKFHKSSNIDNVEEKDGIVKASCSYALLKGNIYIQRELHVDLNDYEILIMDSVTSQRKTEFRQQFIFHPDVKMDIDPNGGYLGYSQNCRFDLHNINQMESDEDTGINTNFIDGWYSPKYNHKSATRGINFKTRTRDQIIRTKIKISPSN